jgi:hypothetical protein
VYRYREGADTLSRTWLLLWLLCVDIIHRILSKTLRQDPLTNYTKVLLTRALKHARIISKAKGYPQTKQVSPPHALSYPPFQLGTRVPSISAVIGPTLAHRLFQRLGFQCETGYSPVEYTLQFPMSLDAYLLGLGSSTSRATSAYRRLLLSLRPPTVPPYASGSTVRYPLSLRYSRLSRLSRFDLGRRGGLCSSITTTSSLEALLAVSRRVSRCSSTTILSVVGRGSSLTIRTGVRERSPRTSTVSTTLLLRWLLVGANELASRSHAKNHETGKDLWCLPWTAPSALLDHDTLRIATAIWSPEVQACVEEPQKE